MAPAEVELPRARTTKEVFVIGTSVGQIAERCEAEFDRLKRSGRVSSVRIERAENILVTHLSCPRANIVRARIRGGELVSYLVKGSGGAVYRVDPESWQCSCPDAHRRGKGCKHALLCWALWRAYRPAPVPTHDGSRRRCGAEPKITRHELLLRDSGGEDLEHVGDVALRVLEGVASSAEAASGSYEDRECSRCFEGRLYDGQRGEWVACEACQGSGRAVVFVYPKERKLQECAGCGGRFGGRDLVEVQESLTYFEGDLLCHECWQGSDADVL